MSANWRNCSGGDRTPLVFSNTHFWSSVWFHSLMKYCYAERGWLQQNGTKKKEIEGELIFEELLSLGLWLLLLDALLLFSVKYSCNLQSEALLCCCDAKLEVKKKTSSVWAAGTFSGWYSESPLPDYCEPVWTARACIFQQHVEVMET